MLNMRTTLVLSSVLSLGLIGSSVSLGEFLIQTQQEDLPYLGKFSESLVGKKIPYFPKLSHMYGSLSDSIEDLRTRSNADIKQASSLPDNIELKLLLSKGSPEEKSRLATVIYGPQSIDYNNLETFVDVMDSHGIIVLYSEERSDFNKEKWYADVLEQRPKTQSIKINDISGIGVAGNPDEGVGSKVIFHRGNIQIQIISVAYAMDDLIKIAETL